MTNQQLHLLKIISNFDSTIDTEIDYKFEGIKEETIEALEDLKYIEISEGEGFVGGVRIISITKEGSKFIETFCDICECMPCDCDWGH